MIFFVTFVNIIHELLLLLVIVLAYSVEYENMKDTLFCFECGYISRGFLNILDISAVVAAAAGCKVVKPVPQSCEKFFEILKLPLCDVADINKTMAKTNLCFVKLRDLYDSTKLLSDICDYAFLTTPDMEGVEKLIEEFKQYSLKKLFIANSSNTQTGILNTSANAKIVEMQRVTGSENFDIKSYEFSPLKYGMEKGETFALTGATGLYNANLAVEILKGNIKGAKLDSVVLNAGAMIFASGIAKNFLAGIMSAYSCIDKGFAYLKIEELQKLY